MFFKKRNLILQETLGEYFRKVRLGKNWDCQTAAQKANISANYLIAIENDEYFKIPGEIYLKNFIKKYARILDIPSNQVLTRFKEEKERLLLQKNLILTEAQKNFSWHFFLNPKFLKFTVLSLFIGLLFFYLGLSLYHFIAPPFLRISFPRDNLISNSKVIIVQGETQNESNVKINNKNILVKADGSFTEEINLKEGLNLIVITAWRKYGRENKVVRNVLVQEANNATQATGPLFNDLQRKIGREIGKSE